MGWSDAMSEWFNCPMNYEPRVGEITIDLGNGEMIILMNAVYDDQSQVVWEPALSWMLADYLPNG